MKTVKNNKKENNFDIAVIGGGPAGMIAAGRAGELGAKVILLEKNEGLGKKLLLTGNGRCNLTNAEHNLRKLVENYGIKGKFLFHAFSVFGPKNVMDFFESLGLGLKIENNGRVFPKSDKAVDVLRSLKKYLELNNVKIACDSGIAGIDKKDGKIARLKLKNGEIFAGKYVICTGGKSYPQTGSNGEGFDFAVSLGHTLEKPIPALSPIVIKEKWTKDLQGVSMENVGINIFQDGKKMFDTVGECLFTHFGLSGPAVLNLSKKIGEFSNKKGIKISIDLEPSLGFEDFDRNMQGAFKKRQNRSIENFLEELFPKKLVPLIVRFSKIDPDKKINVITREERRTISKTLKGVEMTVEGVMGFDQAMVTAGGISSSEIDDKTMKSKLIENLYFAGEIIDVDGPSGGFNLQVCWSTGYLAGENAAK